MKIELKNLKTGLVGRDGIKTWSASVYVDGKRSATVEEYGNGGALNIRATSKAAKARLAEAEAYAATLNLYGEAFPSTLEDLCGLLAAELDILKQLKAKARAKTYFLAAGDDVAKTGWQVVSRPYSPQLREAIKKQLGGEIFAHDLIEAGSLGQLREALTGVAW